MTKTTTAKTMVFWVLAIVVWACAGGSEYRQKLPAEHPEEYGENLRLCLECHDEADEDFPFNRFVHTAFFAENHRQVADQHSRVCTMCHQPSFCDECHGVRIELKPSLKNQTNTVRRMPHRGDYLSRHRIDGRVDPVSCLRCHGNPKTARTCKPCHG